MATATRKPKMVKKDQENPKRWSDLSGLMRIYGMEKEKKDGSVFYTYNTSVGSRREDGSYTNGYIEVRFKKGIDPECEGAAWINVKSGFVTVREYVKDKEKHTVNYIMVTDWDEVAEDEIPF